MRPTHPKERRPRTQYIAPRGFTPLFLWNAQPRRTWGRRKAGSPPHWLHFARRGNRPQKGGIAQAI